MKSKSKSTIGVLLAAIISTGILIAAACSFAYFSYVYNFGDIEESSHGELDYKVIDRSHFNAPRAVIIPNFAYTMHGITRKSFVLGPDVIQVKPGFARLYFNPEKFIEFEINDESFTFSNQPLPSEIGFLNMLPNFKTKQYLAPKIEFLNQLKNPFPESPSPRWILDNGRASFQSGLD